MDTMAFTDTISTPDPKKAYDLFVNACYHSDPSAAMVHVLDNFESVGITKSQLKQIHKKAKANKIPLPDILVQPLPEMIIQCDDNILKLGEKKNIFQNVADKFILFIYGKKFNDGVNGAFGKAQNINPQSRGFSIILRFPEELKDYINRTPKIFEPLLTQKLHSSMKHYESSGKGKVKIEYY